MNLIIGMAESVDDPVFQSLNADDVDPTVTEVESCCMNCYKNVSSEWKKKHHIRYVHIDNDPIVWKLSLMKRNIY